MKSKTRKLIWSVPLMATLAVVGALAVFVALGLPNANPAEAQFTSNAPGAPTAVDAADGNLKLTVTWGPPDSDGGAPITAYTVRHKVSSAADSTYVSATGPGTARSFTITGLANGTPYTVQVFATNSVGDGPVDEATGTPGAVASSAPRDVEVTAGTDRTSLTVSWDAPAENGGADVEAYTVTHFTDATFATVGGGTLGTVDNDARTVTITGLDEITTYYVRVTNNNGNGPSDPGDGSGATMIPNASGEITSSSTTAGSTIELKVTIPSLPKDLAVGSSVELYLEDDYQVPDAIARSAVYFVVTGDATDTGVTTEGIETGNGAPVAALAPAIIATDDHFGGDDDYGIQVVIPDLCTADHDACDPQNGPYQGQSLTLVISKAAGIKNPSEQKPYRVGFSVLDVGEAGNDGPDREVATADRLSILAEISLSDEDNTRGYELTITGKGFNNGTTASAYVLKSATAPADCADVVARGTNIGSTLVGSDDVGTVVVEVSVPTFGAGNINRICMVDGETRYSSDVDTFHLEPSIRAVPSTASSGDTVNIFAQDFVTDSGFSSLELADTIVWSSGVGGVRAVRLTDQSLTNGAATISFEVPGSVGGEPLQGTVRVDAEWGGQSEDTKITVTGSELTASKANVLPNETITITGNGYGSQTLIDANDITLDNVPVEVDIDSTIPCVRLQQPIRCVEVSNSGQFVATITLWPADPDNVDNPTLISGSHTLNVEDNQGFTGSTTLTIAEPTISVTPEVVGPRDYIIITGTNWPVDNSDNSNAGLVDVQIDDDNRGRTYSVYTDATGRFTVEHRVSKDVAIPSTVQITGSYSEVVRVGSFAIPAATITIDPGEAQPGDLISLSATDMKPYTSADEVKIGGSEVNFTAANTDIDGNITLTDLLVPGLDPGVYSVVLEVDDTVAIGELNVLAEDSARGAGAMLPDALSEVGDNLVRVFHFNGVNKSWDFYDPRADFADLNTLTTMVNGEPYWILVSEGQENVVLNNKPRTLTCVGGDCWNQLVW